MTAWPDGLPLPRAEGAGKKPNKSGGRFEVDAGPAGQWATTTAVIDTLTLVYRCTAAQRDTLVGFSRGAANGGVWFTYTNPFTLVDGSARFVIGQEIGETPVAPKFDLAVTLEFRPS